MSLEIQCPQCSTRYRLGDDKAGKKVRCKRCQEVLTVPAAVDNDDPFAVFDDPSGQEEYNGGNDDLFGGSFDMGAAFNETPQMRGVGSAKPKRKKKSAPPPRGDSGNTGLLVGLGVGALVLVGVAVGLFVYFAGKNDDDGAEAVVGARVGFGNVGTNANIRKEHGSLASTDSTLQAGEFYDAYTLDGQRGQRVSISQWSNDFDTFLILELPSGEVYTNDDAGGSGFSAIRVALPETGAYRILATSFEGNETGDYELEIAQSADVVSRVEEGSLAEGDVLSAEGQFEDTITVQGRRGQRMLIQMRSSEMDPLVRLYAPDGTFVENDDAGFSSLAAMYGETANPNSLLAANLAMDGEYRVVATSYSPGITGGYTLVIDQSEPAERVETGSLTIGDLKLDKTGELYDEYRVRGERGQKVSIALSSPDFDPYLILFSPTEGEQFDCDDFFVGSTSAEIVMTLPESGEYRLAVTTYQPGEMGNYVLTIDFE
jgi:predicted Zn finger-like uncharacterized protein